MILYGPSDEAARPARYGFNSESNDAHDLREWKPGEWNSSIIRVSPDDRVVVADQAGCSEGHINVERQNFGSGCFQVGAKAGGSEFLNGHVALIRVDDRPLSDERTDVMTRDMRGGESSPVSSDGLALHLEATNAVAGADGKIAAWEDLSGKGHPVKQTDPERRPALAEPGSPRDCKSVRFSGTQSLVGPAVLAEGDDSFTIAALWRRAKPGGSEVVCEQNASSKADGRRATPRKKATARANARGQ